MATVYSLFPALLLLQWKYHGHCQALKFIYVVGVGFVVSTAITALYSFTGIFGQLVFLSWKNKQKAKYTPDAFKTVKILKTI